MKEEEKKRQRPLTKGLKLGRGPKRKGRRILVKKKGLDQERRKRD